MNTNTEKSENILSTRLANREVSLPSDLVRFGRGKLEWLRRPEREEWEQVGAYLQAMEKFTLIFKASWRSKGREAFGDEVVAETERQLEFDFHDMRALEALEKVDDSISAAPSDAHASLIALYAKGDRKKAEEWAVIARDENLSLGELSRSMRKGEIVRDEKPVEGSIVSAGSDDGKKPVEEKAAGFVSIEHVSGEMEKWMKQVEPVFFDWDLAQCEQVIELLDPAVEFYGRVFDRTEELRGDADDDGEGAYV